MNAVASDPAVRATGIGGSDIAAVAGMTPDTRTTLRVWQEVSGFVERDVAGEAAHWGTEHEEPVANTAARLLGLQFTRFNATLRHARYPYMMAHIDRRVTGAPAEAMVDAGLLTRFHYADEIAALRDRLIARRARGEHIGVEVKTTNVFSAREHWGESSDDLPIHVMLQVQWYYFIAEHASKIRPFESFVVPVLIGGNRLRVYEIRRDPGIIASLERIAVDFWGHVESGTAPSAITYAEACAAFPTHVEQPVEADDVTAQAFTRYRELKATEKDAGGELESLQLQIASYLGERDTLTIGGQPVLTWRSQSAKRLDQSLLKAEQPELYARYSRESKSRVMRLKGAVK